MKKCICIITTLSLVISSISAVYAVDISTHAVDISTHTVDISTPQAISFNAPLSLKAVRSSAALAAASNTSVIPATSNYVYKYWTGSTIQNVSGSLSTWGGLISPITDSIATSIQSLYFKIYPFIDTIESKLEYGNTQFSNIATDIIKIRNSLNYSGASIGSDVYNINENIHTIKELLNNGSGIQFNLKNWQPYFFPEDSTLSGSFWRYDYIPQFNYTGETVPYFDGNESSLVLKIKRYYVAFNRTLTYGFEQVLSGVKADNDFNPVYTNSDLTTTSFSKISFWKSFLEFAQNTSAPLNKLAFVLANDEEIEARQASASNTSAFVDDFIKPSGSGSASASDLGDMAGISSGIQDTLLTGVNPSAAFSSVSSDSSAWEWFTNDTKNALDTTNSNSRLFKSNYSSTPYLDDYYYDLQEKLGGYKK